MARKKNVFKIDNGIATLGGYALFVAAVAFLISTGAPSAGKDSQDNIGTNKSTSPAPRTHTPASDTVSQMRLEQKYDWFLKIVESQTVSRRQKN